MIRFIGIAFVLIWAYDEAAVKVNMSTGNVSLPFLWGGLLPGSKTLAKHISEVYLMVIGFLLILISMMGRHE